MSTVGKHSEPISDFNPLSFGGCVLWLDATSSSNFALSGSNITTWYDASSFSNHAASRSGFPVLSNAAINGRPAVFFSNAPSMSGSLSLTTAGVTGFMVVRPMQLGIGRGDQRIFSAATSGAGDWNDNGRFLIGPQQATTEIRFNRGNSYIPRVNFNASNNYVLSWTYDGLSNYLYLNGADADLDQGVALSNSAFNVTIYGLGNQATATTETYNGFIGEVLIYNDFLRPAQRRAVEGHLAWKWGIAPALGTTFSPLTSLSNCAVWFDGADASTFTLSGSNITQWRDKAGSNVTSNIGTPVYTSNAINGVPGVRLDVNAGFKISPMSNAANTTTVSIYGVVAASSNSQNNARVFTSGRVADGQVNNDYSTSTSWVLYRNLSNLVFGHTNAYVTSSNVLADQTPCLISAIFSGSTGTLWTNGSNIGSNNTTDTFTFDRLGIGKNTNPDAGTSYDAFAGTVGEFLIFYAAHTEAQRLQVESYLASKWNVRMRAPSHLVPTHSYTTRRPFVRDFQPTDIAGCAFWLDAGDRSTLTLSASNTVTAWTDKSKDKRAVTVVSAPTYSSTGFNGRPTLQFTSGQYLSSTTATTFSNAYSMFQVAQTTGSSYQISLAVGGSTNPFIYWWRGDFNSYAQMQEGTAGQGNNRYTTTNVPILHSCVVNSNTPYWNYYTNGIKQINPDLGGYGTPPLSNLGGSNVYVPGTLVQFGGPAGGGFTGNISEVILFSNALTTSERLQVESYLASKWGLRTSFPAVTPHPFKYGPAMILPTQISGCSLWLDAADSSTVTMSGSNVTAWADKSGLGNTLTQSNAGSYPTSVSNMVSFQSNGFLNIPMSAINNTNAYDMFFVFNPIATTNWIMVKQHNGTNTYNALSMTNYANITKSAGTSGYLYWHTVNNGTVFNSSNALSTNTVQLIGVHWDGTTFRIHRNGTLLSSSTSSAAIPDAPSTTNFLLGAWSNDSSPPSGFADSNVTNFRLGEFLFYAQGMNASQRQQIEGYLAWKWGISSNLPGSAGNWVGLYRPLTAEFDPRSVAPCGVWFDAADAATIQFSSGSNIQRWLDKSGGQYHLTTNSTGGNFPTLTPNTLNGRPVVTFNGASGMLGLYAPPTTTTPQSMFVVARPSATNGNRVLVQTPTIYTTPGPNYAMSMIMASWTSTWMYSGFYGANNGISNALSPSTSRTDILAGSWRPSTMAFTVNGTEYGTSTETPALLATRASNSSMMVIGGGWYFPENYYRDFYAGYIAEILVVQSFLTNAERQRIEGYLAWKWGLQSQLPALHPYASTKF